MSPRTAAKYTRTPSPSEVEEVATSAPAAIVLEDDCSATDTSKSTETSSDSLSYDEDQIRVETSDSMAAFPPVKAHSDQMVVADVAFEGTETSWASAKASRSSNKLSEKLSKISKQLSGRLSLRAGN